jgi:hypothetical protein
MEWLSDVSGRRRAQKQALCYYFICQTHHAAYNKVHNRRGCSLSTFFFILYAPTEEERRRHLLQEKGASGECIYIESRLGSGTLRALETSKNACLIIYKRQKCQRALRVGRSFYFLSFHELCAHTTFIPDSHGKVLDSDGVVVAHTRTRWMTGEVYCDALQRVLRYFFLCVCHRTPDHPETSHACALRALISVCRFLNASAQRVSGDIVIAHVHYSYCQAVTVCRLVI